METPATGAAPNQLPTPIEAGVESSDTSEQLSSINEIIFPKEVAPEEDKAPEEPASEDKKEDEESEEPSLEDQAKEEPKVEEAKEETPSKFKLDLGEGEKEYTVEDIKKTYTRAKEKEAVAMKKFNEAYKLNMENKEAIGQAKEVLKMVNDPEQSTELVKYLLKNHGDQSKVKSLVVDMLEQIIDEENMDPKDKQVKELERKLQEKSSLEQKALEQKKLEQDKAEQAKFEQDKEGKMKDWATSIHSAVEKEGLPATNQIYSMVTYYCALQKEQGIPVEPSDVMPLVRRDLKALQKAVLDGADEKSLKELVDDNFIAKVRAMDKARIQASSAPVVASKEKVAKANPKKKEDTEDDRLNSVLFQGKARR